MAVALHDEASGRPRTQRCLLRVVAAWKQVAGSALLRAGVVLMVVGAVSASGGALEYPFVMHGNAYELRSTDADVRLRHWIATEQRYEAVLRWPARGDRPLAGAYPIATVLSASGPYLLVADAVREYSVWRLDLSDGVARPELTRLWSGRLDPVMNFTVAADDVMVVGGEEPVVVTGRRQCRLPDRLRSLNVAAKSDGSAIFYNAGAPMIVAEVVFRTCRYRSMRAPDYAGWHVLDVEPLGRGWLAVMLSAEGESFVVLLDRRGRVTYRYEISSDPSRHPPRYLLTRAENGVFIAGDGTPIFTYDGHSVRRLEAPASGKVIEGSSLRVPIVGVGDAVVRAKFGKEVPGHAVRELWVGPVTLIVESQTYAITMTVCGFVIVASFVMAVRALVARRSRRSARRSPSSW